MLRIISLCLILIFSCSACSNTKATSEVKPVQAQTINGENIMREIEITIDGQKFAAQIIENADTKKILDKLPMDLSMSQLGATRFIYGGNFEPAKGKFHKNFKKGEIALCHSNYFIIFYDDQPASSDDEYCTIGHITQGVDKLSDVAKGGKLHMDSSKIKNKDNEKEILATQYHEMYKYMIDKNTVALDSLMSNEFVLTHMTGKKENKNDYLQDIKNGQLNYYTEKTDSINVAVNGDKAEMVGRSKVSADVYGGSRNTWNLQLAFTLEQVNGKWLQTSCKASTY